MTHSPVPRRAGQSARSSHKPLIGAILANTAFVVELTLVPMLLPAIQSQFGLSISALAWVFNAFAVAVTLGVLLGGWCGDVLSTRKVFGYGLGIFAVGSLVAASSGQFEFLIFGRVLQGFGAGIFAPLVPVILTQISPDRPGRVLIFWGSIAGYVASFAPALFGVFLGEGEWRSGFVLIAVIATAAVVFLALTESAEEKTARCPPTLIYARLIESPYLWLTYLYVFCTYGCITFYLFWLPNWLSESDVSEGGVGLLLSVLWLTFSAMSTMLRNRVDGPQIRLIMFMAPCLIAVGLPLAYYGGHIVYLVASAVCTGAGLACSNAPSTQLILRFAPQDLRGISMSLDITFARLGGIVTVAALAHVPVTIAAVAICLGCLVAAVCAQRTSSRLKYPDRA